MSDNATCYKDIVREEQQAGNPHEKKRVLSFEFEEKCRVKPDCLE